MSADDPSRRRSYGTGTIYVRADAVGRETFYGRWLSNGRRVNRRIGLKRAPGARNGLTCTQAEARLRQLIAEVQVSPAGRGPTMTTATLGERYVAYLRHRGRKRSTVTAVELALREHINPFFGETPIDRIGHGTAQEFARTLERKRLAPKSVHNYFGTLSAMLAWASRPPREWVPRNPCEGVELPGVPEADEIRFLDESEWEALLRYVPDGAYRDLDRALWTTAIMAGLRHGELCALRWRDVDYAALRIRVRRNWVLGEYDTPKSRRATRSVPMTDRLAGELERLYRATGEPGPDALVFGDPLTGAPLDKASNLRRMRRALKSAAVDSAHNLHSLRHTFGTAMAAAGVPMRTLQEWMGHRDIGTTQRYADYAPSPHEHALVESAFAGRTVRRTERSESQVTSEA
jgi:integrase